MKVEHRLRYDESKKKWSVTRLVDGRTIGCYDFDTEKEAHQFKTRYEMLNWGHVLNDGELLDCPCCKHTSNGSAQMDDIARVGGKVLKTLHCKICGYAAVVICEGTDEEAEREARDKWNTRDWMAPYEVKEVKKVKEVKTSIHWEEVRRKALAIVVASVVGLFCFLLVSFLTCLVLFGMDAASTQFFLSVMKTEAIIVAIVIIIRGGVTLTEIAYLTAHGDL